MQNQHNKKKDYRTKQKVLKRRKTNREEAPKKGSSTLMMAEDEGPGN